LFRKLFRGRTDAYPVRWESKTTAKSGYAPACANEWRAGVCEKPRITCSDCGNRVLIPVSDAVLYSHLAGEQTVGIYPLLEDDSCHFLAVDFDGAEWREDAYAFAQSCKDLGVPVALEISRSGCGAHAHPPLDTLILAMPVSWKVTLQQYAGRLHREDAGKSGVRIIDFVDAGHPMLLRMWEKRQRGYRAMGYRVASQQ
jgi:hypothetical protein